MADMSTANKKTELSQEEIDELVIAQAEEDAAWAKPIRVHRVKSASVTLSSELAARAAFLARLHREASVEDWLKRIIQERIDLEEAAFTGLKRDLATKSGD
jgi:fructose-1-phosphate kinase PfkB-like protein